MPPQRVKSRRGAHISPPRRRTPTTAPSPASARHSTELRGDDHRCRRWSNSADAARRRGPTGHRPSGPVSDRRQHSQGIITRWELPIPVYVDPSITGNCAGEALTYWQSVTGLPLVLVGADAEPRITVRAAGPDELNIAIGSGFVYRIYANNRARLAVVKILTSNANCTPPSVLFRHELGHAIGIFGHPPGGLMSAPIVGTTASQREINILLQLYRLPHGARIEPDGTWRVVQ